MMPRPPTNAEVSQSKQYKPLTGLEPAQTRTPIVLELAARFMVAYRNIPGYARFSEMELAIMSYEDAQALINVHNTFHNCNSCEEAAKP